MDFDKIITSTKNSLIGDLLDRTYMTEPYFDRDEDGVLAADEFTDINGNGKWDYTSTDYKNKPEVKNLVDASPSLAQVMSPQIAARYSDANNNGKYDADELYYDENDNLKDPTIDGARPLGDMETWYMRSEAFVDANHNGRYDPGEDFIDSNGDLAYSCARSEPFDDQNKNFVYDSPEPFIDLNGNGVHDTGGSCSATGEPVTVRSYISYYTGQVRAQILRAKQNGTLKATFTALDWLFNPYCSGANCNYVSDKLTTAWNNFDEHVDIGPNELTQIRRFAGSLFYDSAQQQYTNIVSAAAKNIPDVLDEFSTLLYRNGRNNDLIDFMVLGLQKGGAFSYLAQTFKLPTGTQESMLFDDIYTLMNTRNMRCYEGKVTDLNGEPISYCNGLTANDTFWGQTSQLFKNMALNAYSGRLKNGQILWSQSCNYYHSFSDIFDANSVKWYNELESATPVADCSAIPEP